MLFALLVALNQLSCGPLCSADAFTQYSGLLARAQFGNSRVEEAAFLILDSDGRLHAINWKSGESDRVSYVGLRPQRCIGMMHTHRFGDTQPSSGDRDEARRVGLPFVVVTRVAVTVAWPDGTVSTLVEGGRWAAMRRPVRR
jgi:proteasome lid subunit RPN8/RPN11